MLPVGVGASKARKSTSSKTIHSAIRVAEKPIRAVEMFMAFSQHQALHQHLRHHRNTISVDGDAKPVRETDRAANEFEPNDWGEAVDA
jgi:hypothetical protein